MDMLRHEIPDSHKLSGVDCRAIARFTALKDSLDFLFEAGEPLNRHFIARLKGDADEYQISSHITEFTDFDDFLSNWWKHFGGNA